MDISNASTEPYLTFLKSREKFQETIKTTTAALREVQRAASTDDSLLNRLITAAGEPWGAVMNIPSTMQGINDTIQHLSGLWIAQFYSLLDLYLDDVVAEAQRFSSIAGRGTRFPSRKANGGDLSIQAVSTALRGQPIPAPPYEAIFRYFELVRHCVSHRAGLASKALAEVAAEDKKLTISLDSVARPNGRKTPRPSLPLVNERSHIALLPRHSILASEVFLAVARDVDQLLVKYLGTDGLVYMAAYHSLVEDDHPARPGQHRDISAAINYFLSRYRVRIGSGQDNKQKCIAVLKALGQWSKVQRSFKRPT